MTHPDFDLHFLGDERCFHTPVGCPCPACSWAICRSSGSPPSGVCTESVKLKIDSVETSFPKSHSPSSSWLKLLTALYSLQSLSCSLSHLIFKHDKEALMIPILQMRTLRLNLPAVRLKVRGNFLPRLLFELDGPESARRTPLAEGARPSEITPIPHLGFSGKLFVFSLRPETFVSRNGW